MTPYTRCDFAISAISIQQFIGAAKISVVSQYLGVMIKRRHLVFRRSRLIFFPKRLGDTQILAGLIDVLSGGEKLLFVADRMHPGGAGPLRIQRAECRERSIIVGVVFRQQRAAQFRKLLRILNRGRPVLQPHVNELQLHQAFGLHSEACGRGLPLLARLLGTAAV